MKTGPVHQGAFPTALKLVVVSCVVDKTPREFNEGEVLVAERERISKGEKTNRPS